MRAAADLLPAQATPADLARRTDIAGGELKRGALLNATALVATHFRAIFTLLIARLLGPIALGVFSVAWATTDLVSKLGVVGLDDAVVTFVARAEAAGDHLRSRVLFRIATCVAVTQSALVAAILSFGILRAGHAIGLQPQMISAFAVIVWALPGIALYRISTSVSRGMKVMQHDIYSRGITEPFATTMAFLIAILIGAGTFAPEIAAIIGSVIAGIVAWILARRLFRDVRRADGTSVRSEGRKLLAYALPIGADQFLNAFIWRLDVIILGFFVGRAPGVTLTSLGIYGAVAGLANGLRRVSQPFTPIFAPVVAGMTASGEHKLAATTYARLLQWMLWILLPFLAVMLLAGDTILMIYGPAFRQGSQWLAIASIACAINAFVNLGETVIMVQRPGLNLINSLITCAIGTSATLWLIPRFGVLGAALGSLVTFSIQGFVRTVILHFVFQWPNPWNTVRRVVLTAFVAIIPAAICRFSFPTVIGQVAAVFLCLAVFGASWIYYRRSQPLVR